MSFYNYNITCLGQNFLDGEGTPTPTNPISITPDWQRENLLPITGNSAVRNGIHYDKYIDGSWVMWGKHEGEAPTDYMVFSGSDDATLLVLQPGTYYLFGESVMDVLVDKRQREYSVGNWNNPTEMVLRDTTTFTKLQSKYNPSAAIVRTIPYRFILTSTKPNFSSYQDYLAYYTSATVGYHYNAKVNNLLTVTQLQYASSSSSEATPILVAYELHLSVPAVMPGYLGDSIVTRKQVNVDKTLVLKGSETFDAVPSGPNGEYWYHTEVPDMVFGDASNSETYPALCNYAYQSYPDRVDVNQNAFNTQNGHLNIYIPQFAKTADTAGVKTYLTSLNSANTPWTVWYRSNLFREGVTPQTTLTIEEHPRMVIEISGNENIVLKNNVIQIPIKSNTTSIPRPQDTICSHYVYDVTAQSDFSFVFAMNAYNETCVNIKDSLHPDVATFTAFAKEQVTAGKPITFVIPVNNDVIGYTYRYASKPIDYNIDPLSVLYPDSGSIVPNPVYDLSRMKTDWKIQPVNSQGYYNGDWFEISDYQRIAENLQGLKEISEYFYDVQINFDTFNLPEYGSPVKASQINWIEQSIFKIVENTIVINPVFVPKTWVQNGSTPSYIDMNRWESTIKAYMNAIGSRVDVYPKIQFKLEGGKF